MPLIHPEEISSIQGLDLRVKAIVEGFLSGLHKSPFHGFSAEFSEYRNYYPGDPTRLIDWKVYAKTDRLMVKKFEADTNLSATILFDSSESMSFSSRRITKLEYAKTLAASIAYLLIKQNDSVGLGLFSDTLSSYYASKTGLSHFNMLLKQLDHVNSGGQTDLRSVFSSVHHQLKKRGLIIVFSDLLDSDEVFLSELAVLKRFGHDVIVFHLFDEQEKQLKYSERTRFVDKETGETIEMNPDSIQDVYKERIIAYLNELNKMCLAEGIDYFPVSTADFYEHHLLEFLNTRSRKG